MALKDIHTRGSILAAIAEYDKLGREAFLRLYGFGKATNYLLFHEGKSYDSKAIVGVAHKFEYPKEGILKSRNFSGGENTVQRKLQELGFEIRRIDDIPSSTPIKRGLTLISPPAGTPKHTAIESRAPIGSHINYLDQHAKNMDIGLRGELLVVEYEQSILQHKQLARLAEQVKHIPSNEGDGLGYDVISFTPDGEKKYIEVKTTTGSDKEGFFISDAEVRFSRQNTSAYYLYRVCNFRSDPDRANLFMIEGDIEDYFRLAPVVYIASPK